MPRVETSIRITTLDKRQGTQDEATATAHHGPTGRPIGLAATCLGRRDRALQHRARAGASATTQLALNLIKDIASLFVPRAAPRQPLHDRLPAAAARRGSGTIGLAMRRMAPPSQGRQFGAVECDDALAYHLHTPAAAQVGSWPRQGPTVRRGGQKFDAKHRLLHPPTDPQVACGQARSAFASHPHDAMNQTAPGAFYCPFTCT